MMPEANFFYEPNTLQRIRAQSQTADEITRVIYAVYAGKQANNRIMEFHISCLRLILLNADLCLKMTCKNHNPL